MDPRIAWLFKDLCRDGEIVTHDPRDAEAIYRTAAASGISGISLEPAYVLRCPPTTYRGETMRDRAMLYLLLAAVLMGIGILVGHWATVEVTEGLAEIMVEAS